MGLAGCPVLRPGRGHAMPKLLIWSDLHVERWGPKLPVARMALPEHDVLVLAGDICEDCETSVQIASALTDQPVLLIPGNHDLYDAIMGDGPGEAETRMRMAAAKTPNVTLLQNECVEIEGVTFIGATLWTDFAVGPDPQPLALLRSQRAMTDFGAISVRTESGIRGLTPEDTLEEHRKARRFIEESLKARMGTATVLVTHHGVHPGSIAPRFQGDASNCCFVSDLSAIFHEPWAPVLAVHGHTHTAMRYRIGNTRVVVNPLGYPHERSGFIPDLVIEVGAV